MSNDPARYVISVLTRDHVGIVADVSEILYALGGNLEALSQTVVGGWFTMVCRAAFASPVSATDIKDAIERTPDFQAIVMPLGDAKPRTPSPGDLYVVTAIGGDKPGIVRRLARRFADRDINIDDVWNEVQAGRFIIIFHVTVPSNVDPKELRYELEQLASELGVTLRLQHRDIFTATNSLSVHTARLPK